MQMDPIVSTARSSTREGEIRIRTFPSPRVLSLSLYLLLSLSFSLCLSENPSPIVLDLSCVDFVAKLLLSSSFVTSLSRNLDARRI